MYPSVAYLFQEGLVSELHYIDKLHLCFHAFSIKLRVGESSLFPALALGASFALERQCRLTK